MTGSNGVSDVLWLKALLGPSTHTRVGLPSMSSLVFDKGGAVCEGLPTVPALIWLLSCVDPPMLSQECALAESPPALTALIRPLARVYPLMLNQWCDLGEGFSTCLALVGLLPSVDPLVFRQG